MSPEERQILTALFDRVRQAAGQPRDGEAEALIAGEVRAQPYAPYLLAQTVIVQEQALTAAAARIEQLEAELKSAQERASEAPASSGFLGGIGKSLFGDASRGRSSVPSSGGVWTQQGRPVDAPAPAYAPAAQPMQPPAGLGQPGAQPATPWGQRGGGGFLQGALGAAAGVAGGVLLANTIGGLMGSGHKEANAATPASPASTPAAPQAAADSGGADTGSDYQTASYDDEAMDSDLGDWGDDSADI